jgi:arylformamidase
MAQERVIFDISVRLGDESIHYPGDPPFLREVTEDLLAGGSSETSRLALSAHSGTHIDVPAHFVRGGKRIDEYSAGEFVLPAQVIATEDSKAIRVGELSGMDIRPGEALLFKTRNSTTGRSRSGVFSESYVYMTPEAADYCVGKGVSLVGIDYITIDRYSDPTFPVHHRLLGNDILILEGIHLSEVPLGRYTLLCLPLLIKDGEASPVRAVLIPSESSF